MKRLSSKHIKFIIITAFNVIIFTIFTVVLFIGLPAAEVGGTPDDTPHVISRKARVSLSPSLTWEQTLGGTKNDYARAVFPLDKLYIFGDTESRDKDFANQLGGNSLFMTVLNNSGSIIFTKVFGTDGGGDTFVAATLLSQNFLVMAHNAENNGDPYLYLVGLDGEVHKSLNLGTAKQERALGICEYDGTICAAVEVTDTAIGKKSITFFFLDEALTVLAERVTTRVASLSYVTLLPNDEYTFACVANAVEGFTEYPVLIKVNRNYAPAFSDYEKSGEKRALDAVPHGSGYLILFNDLKNDNKTYATQFDLSINAFHAPVYSGRYNTERGRLLPDGSGLNVFIKSINAAALLPYSGGKFGETIDGFSALKTADASLKTAAGAAILSQGERSGELVITAVNGGASATQITIRCGGAEGVAIKTAAGKIIIIANYTGKTGDITETFGGTDILVAALAG